MAQQTEEEADVCRAVQTALRRGCPNLSLDEVVDRIESSRPRAIVTPIHKEQIDRDIEGLWLEDDIGNTVKDEVSNILDDNGFRLEELQSDEETWRLFFTRP